MKIKRNIFIIIFLAVSIGLGIVIYVVPTISDLLTRTFTAEYGEFQVTDKLDLYLVRDEIVYLAPREGELNYYLEQDEMVRKGATILELHPRGAISDEESSYNEIRKKIGPKAQIKGDFQAEFSGILSYYIDGYENIFNPQTMEDIKFENISSPLAEPLNLVREYALVEEPIYKIIKNDSWYLIGWISQDNIGKYQIEKEIEISLPKGKVRAKIRDIIPEGDKWKLIIYVNRYYEDFSRARKVGASLLIGTYKGIIIPNNSIAVVEGKPGVYVINKRGQKVFTLIKILSSDGERSCIASEKYLDDDGNTINTVDIYDTLVRKAK